MINLTCWNRLIIRNIIVQTHIYIPVRYVCQHQSTWNNALIQLITSYYLCYFQPSINKNVIWIILNLVVGLLYFSLNLTQLRLFWMSLVHFACKERQLSALLKEKGPIGNPLKEWWMKNIYWTRGNNRYWKKWNRRSRKFAQSAFV